MTNPSTIYLKDYREPDFFVESIDLFFDVHKEKTTVHAKLKIKKNKNTQGQSLFLQGDNLPLLALKINGEKVAEKNYKHDALGLTLIQAPHEFTLETTTEIFPHLNTALEGLYQSGNMLCTQNEPEGFRKITFFIDRPDNMSLFTTTIEASKKEYPYLLSNGNLVKKEELGERHRVTWVDPFKKPSYLFALVAGDFDLLEDHFTTKSGRKVKLEIFVDRGDLNKTRHAMESLKKSMKWDEDVFGLEYDLDIYMIVAVSSFNMGAMENKGLNIFNSAYVLAKPETATDTDYELVEGVIGHEYFHNWTGNRVTCRDWFQLTLKEGLTVFRDQEFSADMGSRAVKRILDVAQLKNRQFPEDAGPMSHPIKPASYIEINNFYTPTVYEKGAEVIRMIHTLIGSKKFRAGMDRYFAVNDAKAVTTEDFVAAMEFAGNVDLSQFKNWYHQAGTPELKIRTSYDQNKKTLKLSVMQNLAKADYKPFHLPFKWQAFNEKGEALTPEIMLEIKKMEEEFTFNDVLEKPILSLNRGFSAPIKVDYPMEEKDLLLLFAHDSDSFNRYEMGQKLMSKIIVNDLWQGGVVNEDFIAAYKKVFLDESIDPMFKAELLRIPSELELNDILKTPDYDGVFSSRENFLKTISGALFSDLVKVYEQLAQDKYADHSLARGRRALKARVLHLLSYSEETHLESMFLKNFEVADNMTDELSLLAVFVNSHFKGRELVLDKFYKKWKHERLVIDKWFSVQANCKLAGTLDEVKRLAQHSDFSMKVPNRFRSLINSFAMNNLRHFHRNDGLGYEFIASKVIEMDPINPQVAARLVNYSFNVIKRVDLERKDLMQKQMQRILAQKGLSRDTFEVVSKNLE